MRAKQKAQPIHLGDGRVLKPSAKKPVKSKGILMNKEQQIEYLLQLQDTGHMGWSAQEAGVSQHAVKKEREANPDFDNAVLYYSMRFKILDGLCTITDEKRVHAYMKNLGLKKTKRGR